MPKYLAIWWVKAKKWSIIDRATIVTGEPVRGKFCYARHGTGIHEVKIIHTSDVFDDLAKLTITSDGELQVTKALLPHLQTVQNAAEPKLPKRNPTSNLKTVFHSAKKSEMGSSNPFCIPPAPKEVKQEVVEFLEKLVLAIKMSMTDETTPDSITTDENRSSPPKDSPQDSQPSPLAEISHVSAGKSKSINPSLADLPHPTPDVLDPEILIIGHDIQVSKKFKSKLLKRFSSKPTLLTRELILHLVGDKNLKDMRPRNHGPSNFRTIPEDVMKAVDDFVLRHTKNFEKNKITKTISNLADKLRNPARSHIKPETKEAPKSSRNGKKRQREEKADSNESEEGSNQKKKKILKKKGKKGKRVVGDLSSTDGSETELVSDCPSHSEAPRRDPKRDHAFYFSPKKSNPEPALERHNAFSASPQKPATPVSSEKSSPWKVSQHAWGSAWGAPQLGNQAVRSLDFQPQQQYQPPHQQYEPTNQSQYQYQGGPDNYYGPHYRSL